VESHRSFAREHRLPFTLLSDEGGKVRKLYGVSNTFGLFWGRATYVIDEKGVIRHVFSSQLGARRHVEEALKILTFIGCCDGTWRTRAVLSTTGSPLPTRMAQGTSFGLHSPYAALGAFGEALSSPVTHLGAALAALWRGRTRWEVEEHRRQIIRP
jgi:hypothetical protein